MQPIRQGLPMLALLASMAGCAQPAAGPITGSGTVEAPEIEPWPGAAQTPVLAPSTVLLRTESARSVGGFDAYLNAFAEWDLALRLSDWWGVRQVASTVTTVTADPLRSDLAPSLVEVVLRNFKAS